ncbi:hypothetical protein BDV25DRAFT_155284 [Aspergillus avenaceus]|uniref:Uncharacterized protein n=1 Tax=Aspergillus avenaceus TaxID=36643 RepID=A0A5N6TUI2_ASPAV|nr:hypothetical protein BDV25DRAFT_155284 [Aspergillus avenaceus]
MLSPTSFAVPRQAPPVRPSRSLEGLEKVIPPRAPLPPARPTLRLDKPLPDLPTKPLPETPSMEGSTAWSEDSSTDVSLETRRPSDASTESYPVFVRSPSDDLGELVEHPSVPVIDRASTVKPCEHSGPSHLTIPTLSDDCHEYRQYWSANRAAPNHYFREKKWDFFPELATPSELPPSYPKFPVGPRRNNSSRLNLAAFDFTKKSSRRANPEKRTLAHDMRNSIRSYVQRRLSKHSIDKEKPKRPPRPSTAHGDYPEECQLSQKTASSNYSEYSDHGSTGPPQNFLDLTDELKRLSVSTGSSACEDSPMPNMQVVLRPKQLPVPLSAYQKYGPAIFDKPGREKRISYKQRNHVRFPRYKKTTSFLSDATSKDTPDLDSPIQQNKRGCVKALQDRTSYVLVALSDARDKIANAQVDRRRKNLKSKIRLIGPVNPYTTYGRVDPWI